MSLILATDILLAAASLQTAPPPAGDPPVVPVTQAPVAPPGEIVITARRRTESAQSVPIAVSVLSAEQIDATGSYNVSKLVQLQPSLTFYSTNPRNSAANIRGLGAPFGLTNDGIEQGVGIYVDQVYYSRIAASTFDFLDVERMEVLRGPQGTLYGKNTTAGAINITTRKPLLDRAEARAELSAGNYDFVQAKVSGSAPIITDRLGLRVAASITDRRGTVHNVTTGRDVNEQSNFGVRGQLLWRASDALDITLAGDFNRQDPDCCVQIFARVGATQRPLNRQYDALAAAFGYAPPSRNAFDRLTDLDAPLSAEQEMGGASLTAEWQLGRGTLTSVTAWRFWDWKPSNDRDFTGLPITTVSANPSQQRQYTQELRYSGSNGSLDYVGGLFGFHQTIETQGLQRQGPAASRWLLGPTGADPAALDGLTSENDIRFRNTSVAAFGQMTWRVNDALSIQSGLRVNYDRKTGAYRATVTNGTGTPLTPTQLGQLAPQSYEPEFSDWNVSGDLTVSYTLDRDVMAYATYARSFKSGGINLSGVPLDANSQPILSAGSVRPEQVNHYEVGLKSQWFDRRLTLNIAGFWTEIGDYQATVTNGQLGVLRGYLANAEKVRVRGIEIEGSARPTDQLSLYASTAFTDARYARFVDAPCPPELTGGAAAGPGTPASPAGTPGGRSPANCDISGQWLPGVSRLSASFGGEYAAASKGEVEAYLGVDGSYRSRFSSNPSRSSFMDVEGYALVNFRLGVRTPGNRFNAFAWIRNAFDQRYHEVLALQPGSTGLVVGQPGDPRTYGVTVARRF